MSRRESIELIVTFAIVAVAARVPLRALGHVATFLVAALALAALARLVGTATEQLGARLGSGGAGVVQSALGNLPELFIAIFALRARPRRGSCRRRSSARSSRTAFSCSGSRSWSAASRTACSGSTRSRARMVSTLTLLAAATMAMPSLAHAFHTPAAPHGHALSLVCAGVLLAVFVLTLPSFIRAGGDEEHEPARWSPADDGDRPRRSRAPRPRSRRTGSSARSRLRSTRCT